MPVTRLALLILALLGLGGAQPASADAASFKKAIWGPVTAGGQSQFPIYRELGVGVYETGLEWDHVVPTRPAHPRDPNDPAYKWPAIVDDAVAQAASAGIAVSITLTRAPKWASGDDDPARAPRRPADYANFAEAAARHYKSVRYWMIWGEPTRLGNFRPLNRDGARLYARMLDAAYASLKRVRKSNLVVGGNTFTVGELSPVEWLRALRLPSGKRPRMDLWGHNPFSRRVPRLKADPLIGGYTDFSSLDDFARKLDRVYRRKHLRFFLSEFTVPTGHKNWLFNFFESEQTQADWLRAALEISRSWRRIAVLGWYQLYDEPARPNGDETLYGLITQNGRRKPAFEVFRTG
jgi:hypothetical protein